MSDNSELTAQRIHAREDEGDIQERPMKKTKTAIQLSVSENAAPPTDTMSVDVSEPEKQAESMLPPSHALLGAPPPLYTTDGSMQRIMETDVGISQYIGSDVPQVSGIIKQR